MLTEIEKPSLTPSWSAYRPGAIVSCGLPDAQTLVEVSLREIESLLGEYQRELQALNIERAAANGADDYEQVDQIRSGLREINARCLRQLNSAQDRIAVRHHHQGRFGAAIVQLRTELDTQIGRMLADERELGELSAEQDVPRIVCCLNSIAAGLRGASDRLVKCLQDIRRNLRQAKSASSSSNDCAPNEKMKVREQFARILARWWQTCSETPGPTTIALIDADRIALDCPELDRAAVVQLLNSAAGLIANDRRAVRSSLTIDTPVISNQGKERFIAWSCALIEDASGNVQSIIAAGLVKTNRRGPNAGHETPPGSEMQLASVPSTTLARTDRRRKQRNPFPNVQLIAPCTASGLPPTAAFSETLCHDISEDGFSFLAASMPSSTTLVVALGTSPPHIYMTARVAHFSRCDDATGIKYIVGCQFIGRTMLMAQFS